MKSGALSPGARVVLEVEFAESASIRNAVARRIRDRNRRVGVVIGGVLGWVPGGFGVKRDDGI